VPSTRVIAALALLVSAVPGREAQPQQGGMAGNDSIPPLYHNLGTLHRAIRTDQPLVQQYFDQGLRLTYAFNHAEAVKAFQYAATLDSTCAMCWWGIGNALGPNINLPMDSGTYAPAFDAAERAQHFEARESPGNRALIAAQSVRYAAQAPADRSPLDSAYAGKLRAAFHRFPDDPDIGALFGESLLDLRPWNQWKRDGTPQPGTLEAVAALEKVIATYPDHPGACHFYIHTVEGSQTPERALACAHRLVTLMPGAGHLVHMPAHIALRLGRYQEAIDHNKHAVHSDEQYYEGPHVESIYGVIYKPHNWHFLSVAASLAGQGQLAIDAARETRNCIPVEVAKEIPPAEFFLTIPYFALVRFGRWDDLLAEPAPDPALTYTKAMWHYGHGMALVAKGDLAGARADADTLATIHAATPADAYAGAQLAQPLLGIADESLQGKLAAASGQDAEAVAHFEKAVAYDESLNYDEPPPPYIPTREFLGMELLRQNRVAEAIQVFRADLRDHRENGWALHGLVLAYRVQNRPRAAAAMEARFRKAWRNADYAFP
jgi:tetratricopeptide (TPR) repeat protein